MTESDAVLQSILVALRESTTYNNTCQALKNLGLDLSIDIDVKVTRSAKPDAMDAKFLQDMHIAPDVVPVVCAPKALEPTAPMPTTFTWWLLQKIGRRLRKGTKS